ncbi:MSHA biogenesis protein MshP [Vibrio sp. RE86]|uniref:MSHA biogenesis protein MshP n=1 Tax=Vibrio sp. RE86 TaxID=2607605 RepID=UPI001493D9F5|nr:MSHA biogenesis protein MshP [Vibrio sp. RE86]NOH79154.1 MSHA biogenesis protein MshP [Vibrio sp. RE86]
MRKSSTVNNKQRGGAMLVILVMTVVVMFFSAQLMSMNVQATQTNTYEVLSTQSYWAARSAMEREVFTYFPNDGTAAATCPVPTLRDLNIAQIPGCDVTMQCEPNGDAIRLNAIAVCSEESFRVSRRVEVEIRP